MIVAFTGHRPPKLGGFGPFNEEKPRVVAALTTALKKLQEGHGELMTLSGMALGFDQWAALTCIGLNIPFEAAIPFKGQETTWPARSQAHYRFLLSKARKIHVVCEGGYAAWKMQKRNEFMVDRCDLLIGCWNGSSGGTANCLQYADRMKKSIHLLEW